MIFKKIHFPIFILLFIFSLSSCNENIKTHPKDEYVNLRTKGLALYENQNFDSAFYYFYKAKEVCKNSEKERIAYALYFIAEMQFKQSDFIESEASATEIIKLHPKYNSINDIYNLLGL